MSIEVIVALAGMLIGTSFMLLSSRRGMPKEFRWVGAFLLLGGFCWILHIQMPKI